MLTQIRQRQCSRAYARACVVSLLFGALEEVCDDCNVPNSSWKETTEQSNKSWKLFFFLSFVTKKENKEDRMRKKKKRMKP